MGKRFLNALPALLFAVSGLVVCIIIEGIHAELKADVTYVSFCNVNSRINCDVVLASPYAYLLGRTVSFWGLLFYGLTTATVVASVVLDRARRRETAALAVFGMSILGLGFSLYMAVISFFVLKTVCLMCSALYLASLGLFASAWRLRSTVAPLPKSKAEVAARSAQQQRYVLGGVGGGLVFALIGIVSVFGGGDDAGGQLSAAEIRARKPDIYRWFKDRPRADPGPGGHALGPEDASVTLIGFSDFDCPHCAKLDETLRELIRSKHPDLKVVFRHFPLSSECNPAAQVNFHPDACSAAAASECAGEQGKFWPYQQLLFEHQGAFQRPQLLGYATEVGLDVNAFTSCLDSDRARDMVRRDAEEGQRLGVQSTPTFFLNGRRIEGAPKGEVLLDAITLAREESSASGR